MFSFVSFLGDRGAEKDKCYMDVVACPLYDKAKALEAPEAVQMICYAD